jgi:hypothetical protein
MRCAARNYVVSGSLERCIIVPAVTEVCRPQSRHSCKRGRLFSPTARRLPQPGHTKPSGQRRLNKKAALLSSSENDFWNSASDRALAISVRPRDQAMIRAMCRNLQWSCSNEPRRVSRTAATVPARAAAHASISSLIGLNSGVAARMPPPMQKQSLIAREMSNDQTSRGADQPGGCRRLPGRPFAWPGLSRFRI